MFHTIHSFPAILTVQDSTHNPQPIHWVNPHEGIAVVGVIQALSGTQKPALTALQAKAKSLEQALHRGFIPWSLAWMALHWVIWPSLQYPLAVTSFSEPQALSITSWMYCTLLPCLGANQHYPLALQHALVKYHGLGLPQPFWEQGTSALKLVLEFMSTSHPEQSLLQMSLEYLQLKVGISTPILQSDFKEWGSLATNCWLKHLWSFVSSAQIQLIPNQLETFPLQWEGDVCIMDKVMAFHPIPNQLAALN